MSSLSIAGDTSGQITLAAPAVTMRRGKKKFKQ